MSISQKELFQAKLNRMWLLDPLQFDPNRNCMEKERIQRTLFLLDGLQIKKAIDLGCGFGSVVKHLHAKGINVDALDACSKPLKSLSEVLTILDCLPNTLLEDKSYDLVIATDVITYLPENQFRLFFSELARIITKDGFVLCSTPLDIDTEDSLLRFISLAETEFEIQKEILSYHSLWIRLYRFLKAPQKYLKAYLDPEFKQQWLENSSSLKRRWILLNTKTFPQIVWKGVSFIFKPFLKVFRKNRTLLLLLEKLSTTASHVVFLGKKKPLVSDTREEEFEELSSVKVKQRIWT